MQQAIGRILKGDDVELEGQYRLQVTQPEPSSAESQRLGAARAEVRLVENHAAFAVIEVTCTCGRRTYLRCQYPSNKSDREVPQGQNETLEAPEQVRNQSDETEKTQ